MTRVARGGVEANKKWGDEQIGIKGIRKEKNNK
jgi:hypothetical protein